MSVDHITTISPTTNLPILTRSSIADSDVALLPALATQAFNDFRHTSLAQRQLVVEKALRLISAKQDVLARELAEQMGRPIAYGAKEITTAVARGLHLLKISNDVFDDTQGEAEEGYKRYIKKVPVGPVLIIFAWNVGFAPFPPFPPQNTPTNMLLQITTARLMDGKTRSILTSSS